MLRGIEGGEKIYNSANKVFSLSKFHPIGIMVFGNATFMGIPWETIIKIFRDDNLFDKSFDKVKDYADELIGFLKENKIGVSEKDQSAYVKKIGVSYFNKIYREIQGEIKLTLKIKKEINEEESVKIIGDIIDYYHQKLSKRDDLSYLPESYASNLKNKFSEEFKEAKKESFDGFKFSQSDNRKLDDILCFLFTKNAFTNFETGIVVAGFGDQEIFPSVISYRIECLILKKLKFMLIQHPKIDEKTPAFLSPFAQSEMVNTFMEGVDPLLFRKIQNKALSKFKKFSNRFKENKTLDQEFNKFMNDFKKSFKKEIYKDFMEIHVNSILDSVAVLPKDELASLAESLVSLTSLKRKISFRQKETVGGPIDVAIISKGDGFIWIKRKHYFKPEPNYQFFENYFLRESRKKTRGGK